MFIARARAVLHAEELLLAGFTIHGGNSRRTPRHTDATGATAYAHGTLWGQARGAS